MGKILSRILKVMGWYIDLNGFKNKSTCKYLYPTSIKNCELLIIDTQMKYKKDNTVPTLSGTFNVVPGLIGVSNLKVNNLSNDMILRINL